MKDLMLVLALLSLPSLDGLEIWNVSFCHKLIPKRMMLAESTLCFFVLFLFFIHSLTCFVMKCFVMYCIKTNGLV